MSGNERRWFQIHLSTAIVLMFVASGILWANIRTLPFAISNPRQPEASMHGWPFAYRSYFILLDSEEATIEVGRELRDRWHNWHVLPLLGDLLVAIAILLCVAIGAERLLRRREARKP